MTGSRQRRVALLVAGCFFMENLDGTIVTTSAVAMANSLGVPVTGIGLVVSAYLMTVAVMIPASGWASRRFGTRRVFLVAVVVFTLASAACALSWDLTSLITARVLQGVGGALMVPVGRSVVLQDASPSQIIRLVAYLTWPGLVAPVMAPLVGALITTHASWRWLFLINVPPGLVAFALGIRLVDDVPKLAPGRIDWVGFVLAGGGLGALVYAADLMSGAGTGLITLVASGLAAVLLVAAVRHLSGTREPLIDLAILRLRTFGVAQGSSLLFCLAVDAVPFLLPLLLQQGRGWTSVRAGAVVLVVFGGNLLAKPATTWLLNRFGFRPVLLVSVIGVATTTATLGWAGARWPLPVVAVVALANGATRSVGFTAYNTVALADVTPAQMTDANALAATTRQLGAALGVALASVLLHFGQKVDSAMGPAATATAATSTLPYVVAFALVAVAAVLAAAHVLFRLPMAAGDNLRAVGANP